MSYNMYPDESQAVDLGQSAVTNLSVGPVHSLRNGRRPVGLRLGSLGLTLLASSCTLESPSFNGGEDAGGSASNSATAAASQSARATASTTAASSGLPPTGSVASSSAPAVSATATLPESDSGSPSASSPAGEPDAGDAQAPAASSAPDTSTATSDAQITDSSAPDAGSADTGAPNDDGGQVVPDDDVHGRVIDFYGRPLPDTEVRIGAELVTTNDDGEFTVADVPETYSIDVRVERNGNSGDPYLWRYIGLTRRDPTLQSFQSSLPERYTGILIDSDLRLAVTRALNASALITTAVTPALSGQARVR
jgi:hypothetical protein